MLSSRVSSDDEDGEEGESTTPGDYESWSRTTSRVTPRTPVISQQTTAPPISRASSRSPRAANLPPQPKFWPPESSPDRSRRKRSSRRRSKTPEIAIERKQHHHHHHHHHSHRHRHHRSSEPDRIIRIPLDNYPTLNMCRSPRQVLEIERVRCRRRRKHRSCCRKIDYNIPPPSLPVSYLQPQSNIIYTNPLPPLYSLPPPPPPPPSPLYSLLPPPPLPPPLYSLPPPPPLIVSTNSNPQPSWISTFPHLTPQIIENLPRQIVHLPPIYMPGSQADPNTDLDTVIFPAEMIDPIDGTLSIIQSNSTLNSVGTTFTQSPPISPVQSQFISAPTTTVHSPTAMISRSSGPFMQQVQDLFQRFTLSQPQSMLSPYYQNITQPSQPVLPQYTTAMNSLYNPQITLPSDTTNIGPYPPANIRPIVAQYSGPYNTTTFTPNYSSNTRPYPPANITPYRSSTDAQYNSLNNKAYQSTDIGPYSPANITPYTSWNASNTIPSNQIPSNIPPYTSNIGPYSPANITPYSRRVDQSNDFSTLSPPIPTPSMPYNELTPFVSSTSFNSTSSALNDHSLSIPPTSSLLAQTPYQSSAMTTTKSILRNRSSNQPSSTVYTRLNPPNVSSSNVVTRELATVV